MAYKVTKYANSVHSQVNPNATKRFDWSNVAHACGGENDTFASASSSAKNRPYVLSAHDFRLDIPVGAYIKNVRFDIRCKASQGGIVQQPYVGFMLREKNTPPNTVKTKQTGFYGGVYWDYGNKSPLTKTAYIYYYEMTESDLKKLDLSNNGINSTSMGVDIHFDMAKKDCTVYVDWVRVVVTYDLPNYQLQYTKFTSETRPHQITIDEFAHYDVMAEVTAILTNYTNAIGTTQELDVILPYGCSVVEYETEDNRSTYEDDVWTVPARKDSHDYLCLGLNFKGTGLKELRIGNSTIGYKSYWFLITADFPYSDGGVVITMDGECHKNHPCCMEYRAYISSNTNEVSFDIMPNFAHNVTLINMEILWSETTEGVEFDSEESSWNEESSMIIIPSFNLGTLYFNLSDDLLNRDVKIAWKMCYYIHEVGDNHQEVSINTGDIFEYDFVSLDPYTYIGEINSADDTWRTHRILSDGDIQAYIFPCGVKEYDANMIQGECTLSMYKWEMLDYIGCVPLEHLHFDPKSTYKDTLLNNTYKNKQYMGKKGVIDEDISLNVRLHPAQVTTIQGFISMDKPIPINANHKCFEGDALNHRGWAEIYKITASETNPHWYKCDIDVKYLTHDIHTKFEINKAKKSSNLKTPELLATTFESGDDLVDLFDINTDGTYHYIPPTPEKPVEGSVYEDDPKFRNVFTLDNEQSLVIRTKEPVKNISNFKLYWASSMLSEAKENRVSRIVRVLDARNNQPVLQYEYLDYDFSDAEYPSASVTALRFVDDDWEDVISNDEISFDIQVRDDDSQTVYGTALNLDFNNNSLDLVDEGFNGREVYSEDIELTGKNSYYIEFEIKNMNTDGEDSDILFYLDAEVLSTVLSSSVDAQTYNRMYISPFPVADKHLLFTRNSEDGTIYYYDDDGNRFLYMIEPFYQYHTGVDLKTRDGIQLFNLNNSYPIVYVQNGLVRLGLNRLNGDIYLSKYDPHSKRYVTTHNLHINNFAKFSIGAFSDDKIEINTSKSKFTMWRGHPFVLVNHSTEDIYITTKTQSVWAEGVGSTLYDYPINFDLLNHDNLLDACVGGYTTLDPKCIELIDDEVEVEDISVSFNLVKASDSSSVTGNPITNTQYKMVVPNVDTGTVHYLLDGVKIGETTGDTHSFEFYFKHNKINTLQVIWVKEEDTIAFSDITTYNVDGYGIGDGLKLYFINHPKTVKYMDNHPFTFRLVQDNVGYSGASIDVIIPSKNSSNPYDLISTLTTNSGGYATLNNDRNSFEVGKYRIGARYHIPNSDDYVIGSSIVEILKNNPIITFKMPTAVGDTFVAKITDPMGNPITNTKLTVTINGTKYIKTTNSNGRVSHKINSKGFYTYIVSWTGDKNMNAYSKKDTDTLE